MKARLLLPLLLLSVAQALWASSPYTYVRQPDTTVYFGHISYCDPSETGPGSRVLREGRATAESAVVNLPLAAGDTILTPPGLHCEAQFDTGTLLRLDGDSQLRIETVLAPSLTTSDKLTNLSLARGRAYLMYRDYDSSEVFQILTPNAALKLSRSAVLAVQVASDGGTELDVKSGSLDLLYGPLPESAHRVKVKAGQRLAVSADHRFVPLASGPIPEAFLAWNTSMNERFQELHRGQSALPKPVLRYPLAVVNFAQRWSSVYGEWIWSDLYGYAWRPYLSSQQGWRPYLYGYWAPVGNELFWVPEEPWGWVPYHLGLWTWNKQHGWVWIPGGAFAPAWVAWDYCSGYFAWRPWSLADWWQLANASFAPLSPWSSSSYGDSLFFSGLCGGYRPPVTRTLASNEVVSNQNRVTPSPQPIDDPPRRLPIPREIGKIAARFLDAAKAGDPDVLASLDAIGRSASIVRQGDVAALRVQEKLLRPGAGGDPSTPERAVQPENGRIGFEEAVARAFERTAAPAREAPTLLQPLASISMTRGVPQLTRVGRSAEGRFRDFNPDVRAAQRVGGTIHYSSVDNQVRCSGCRVPLMRTFSAGGTGGWIAGSGGPSSSSSADGGVSSGASASAGAGARGEGGSRAGGGTEKVKN